MHPKIIIMHVTLKLILYNIVLLLLLLLLVNMQFPRKKHFPLSDVDKIKVIDKIKVDNSKSVFSLHKTL